MAVVTSRIPKRSAALGLIALLGAVSAVAQPEPDRSTPRRSVLGYLEAARAGDYAAAAGYLDLRRLPRAERAERGSQLARRLKLVLDRRVWIDPDTLSDDPDGDTADGLPALQDRVAVLPLAGGTQGIRLARVAASDDGGGWLFSASTVAAIDALYAEHGAGWLAERLPRWLSGVRIWELELWQLVALALLVPLAWAAGRLLAPLLSRLLAMLAERTANEWDEKLAAAARRPLRLFLSAAAVRIGAEGLGLSVPAEQLVTIGVRTASLIALGLFARGALVVLLGALEGRLAGSESDAVRRRAVATQLQVLERVGIAAVTVLVGSLVLAQFEVMRSVGLSLLASAGVAGLAVTFAAQRSIANLFAGLQILVTQPIRIDDVVIVEGEWGRIEEINFTHVVVKIWDLRRLVVPITYFLEKPFQNWTRVSEELLGTIFFYTDHTVDLEAMRAELDRILEGNELWDGKASGLLVTGIKDHVVEVRALISAKDSSDQWDLRCQVRERLLAWLSRHTASLPTVRLDAPRGLRVGSTGAEGA